MSEADAVCLVNPHPAIIRSAGVHGFSHARGDFL
jgi:hypothetical protein